MEIVISIAGLIVFVIVVKIFSDAVYKIIHKEKKEKDFDFDKVNNDVFGDML